jgi:hypothetical protein
MEEKTMTSKATKRISLVDGLKREEQEPSLDTMRQFVKTGNVVAKTEISPEVIPAEPAMVTPPEETRPVRREPTSTTRPESRTTTTSTMNAVKQRPSRVQPVALVPVTIRLRPELAGALKRASLERQLSGDPVFTQQDMVEEALTPWLKKAGFL